MTDFLRIASWNINSVRIRIERLVSWIQSNNPDIVLLQEIKCLNDFFPYQILEDLGYNIYVNGQKSYNGVAILSKIPADNISYNFKNNHLTDQSRYIEISLNLPVGYSKISSIYVPNGGDVGSEKFNDKMIFLDNLKNYLKSEKNFENNFIIGGDFNVAIDPIDVYSSSELKETTCFTLEERKKVKEILNLGFCDIHRLFCPNVSNFSWWDYRRGAFQKNEGMRIDYFLTNYKIAEHIKTSFIDVNERSKEKSSDHSPVIVDFFL